MPVYNNAPFVEGALRSLLNQSHRDLEVIMVDDGSTDGSGDIARSLGDSRVRVVPRLNGGCAAARNTGLDHISEKSEAVTFHDGDDVSLPHRFTKLIQALETSGAAFAYSGMLFVDPDLRPMEYVSGGPVQRVHCIPQMLHRGNIYNNISFLIRRSAIGDLKSDETLKIGEDAVFSSHIASQSEGIFVPEALMLYRRHPRSASLGETQDNSLMWRKSLIDGHDIRDLAPEAFASYPDNEAAEPIAWALVALAQARLGHSEDAAKLFQRALRYEPCPEALNAVSGLIDISIGNDEQARAKFAKYPPTAVTLLALAELERRAGSHSAAVSAAACALAKYPDYFLAAKIIQGD